MNTPDACSMRREVYKTIVSDCKMGACSSTSLAQQQQQPNQQPNWPQPNPSKPPLLEMERQVERHDTQETKQQRRRQNLSVSILEGEVGLRRTPPDCRGLVLPEMRPKSDAEPSRRMYRSSLDELRNLVDATMSFNTEVYHNRQHVRDVAAFVTEAVHEVDITNHGFLSTELVDALVAAAYLHDVYHPAGGDRDTIKDVTELVTGRLPAMNATRKHMQGSIGASLIKRTRSFRDLNVRTQEVQVDLVTKLILTTAVDTYDTAEELDRMRMDDAYAVAKLILRCADMHHYTFALPEHLRCTTALQRELSLGAVAAQQPEEQVRFIDKYVLPQYRALARICGTPRAAEWLNNVEFKRKYWRDWSSYYSDKGYNS